MRSWIDGLISAAVAPLRTLISDVRDRISGVYHAFVDTFGRVRNGFIRWVQSGQAWVGAQERHAASTLLRLRRLTTVIIPRRLGQLANSIQTWTRARLAELGASVRADARRLRDWAAQGLRNALSGLAQVRDFLLSKITALRADVNSVFRLVGSLLTSPQRMATWLVAAMASALLRYALANADRLAEQVIRRRTTVEVQAVNLAERIADRIG